MRNLIALFFLILMFCPNLKSQDAIELTEELRSYLDSFRKNLVKASLNNLTLCANLARKISDEKRLSLHIKSLVEERAAIDYLENFSPSHFAAQAGDESLLSFLIQKKANIDAKDTMGWTPLMHATRNNQGKLCRALLEMGASLTIQDNNGHTALMGACGDTIEALADANVDVNEKDKDGLTPLIHAVKNQDQDALIRLIKSGADINYQQNNETVLQSALNADASIVMTLIGAGADFKKNYFNGKNHSVVQKIISSQNQLERISRDRTIQYALAEGLGGVLSLRLDELIYKNPFEHCLYTAIRLGSNTILNEILRNLKVKNHLLSRINGMTSYETTPLFFALIMENSDAIDLLFSYGASAMIGPNVFVFLEQKYIDNLEKKSAIKKKLCENCRDYGIACIFAMQKNNFPNEIVLHILNFLFEDKNKILRRKWVLTQLPKL